MNQETEGVRINKYLSEIGHCSRRAADKLIEENRIKVNGQTVIMGQKVTAQDRIEVDDILVEALDEAIEEELMETASTVMLTPIKVLGVNRSPATTILKPVTVKVLTPVTTNVLTPVTTKVLTPVKRRSAPPSSAPGAKPGEIVEEETTE